MVSCMEWPSGFVIADVGQSSLDRGLLLELAAGAARASAPASDHTTQLKHARSRNWFQSQNQNIRSSISMSGVSNTSSRLHSTAWSGA